MATRRKLHPCTQYAIDVVSGKRITGRLERLACERHLTDLDRQGSKNFPWVFSEEKANRIYEWFRYCKHLEGPLAGEPIELQPFQMFDLGCVFGWVHKDTGFRRFKKGFIEEARKNGKSITMSGVALYLMCGDSEESPQVYCTAVDKKQARIVYKAAKNMAEKSPDIRKRLRIRNYEISHITRNGELSPFSRETKNKDGFNPSGVIIDEYHAHPTSEMYDLMETARGQRSQALMLIISTAGMNAVNNPCFIERDICKQIVEKTIHNERYFVMIREMDPKDNIHDPKNWIKCNPLKAATKDGLRELKEMHDEAFDSRNPTKIRSFKIKNLNIWVHDDEASYMGDLMANWDEMGVTREKFAELTRGLTCLNGADLSKSIDLTADGFVFELPDGRIAITAKGFIPEESVQKHERTDRIEYREWAKESWCTITDGAVTDYDAIKTHIHDMELENQWKILEFCYDPYNATHFAKQMEGDGYSCVEIRQTMVMLSEPTKLFREYVANKKIVHDGSPLLKWCVANAKAIQDSNENIKISKKNVSDTNRIDLLAAILTAMVRISVIKGVEPRDISDDILSDDWGM